jgi:hypothetical protein
MPLPDSCARNGTILNYLAVQKNVAASTQNQALSAVAFLYVLRQDFEGMDNLERAKKPARLPIVLTESEARSVGAPGWTWRRPQI